MLRLFPPHGGFKSQDGSAPNRVVSTRAFPQIPKNFFPLRAGGSWRAAVRLDVKGHCLHGSVVKTLAHLAPPLASHSCTLVRIGIIVSPRIGHHKEVANKGKTSAQNLKVQR
jgi:hypothetical protein